MAKKKYAKMSNRERQLDAIKQGAPRERPRSVVFNDKTKYDRNRSKSMLRRYGE